MSEIFRVSDLMNSLVELERTGNGFYTKMAGQADDEKIKALFSMLAGEELKHEKIYSDLAKEFRENGTAHEVDGEYGAYLKALVAQHFAFSAENLNTLDAALSFAVSLEKETLIFIAEIQNILGTQKAELFGRIKGEEQKHLLMLMEYKK